MERIHAKKIFEHNPGDHVARYIWARDLLMGKKTLDCGCGEGYGTAWLSKNGFDIVGLDCSRHALISSKSKCLVLGNILSIPFCSNLFDAIISFEVVEHLEDGNQYFSKICDVLKPGGLFIGSTPIRKPKKYQNGKPKNPYHKKEYYINEIRCLLKQHFDEVTLYGQSFPSILKSIILSQLQRLRLLRQQQNFYPIHEVSQNDEKCLWVAVRPKKI